MPYCQMTIRNRFPNGKLKLGHFARPVRRVWIPKPGKIEKPNLVVEFSNILSTSICQDIRNNCSGGEREYKFTMSNLTIKIQRCLIKKLRAAIKHRCNYSAATFDKSTTSQFPALSRIRLKPYFSRRQAIDISKSFNIPKCFIKSDSAFNLSCSFIL